MFVMFRNLITHGKQREFEISDYSAGSIARGHSFIGKCICQQGVSMSIKTLPGDPSHLSVLLLVAHELSSSYRHLVIHESFSSLSAHFVKELVYFVPVWATCYFHILVGSKLDWDNKIRFKTFYLSISHKGVEFSLIKCTYYTGFMYVSIFITFTF